MVESDSSTTIAFSRFTQISVLRLLTTAAAMNGKPLTMGAAWRAYDRLFEDDGLRYYRNLSRWSLRFVISRARALRPPRSGQMLTSLPLRQAVMEQ